MRRDEAEAKGIDWELRPGGMVVQKREEVAAGAAGPMIKIKVSHGACQYDVAVPVQSTFGELKRILTRETGLEPQEQRLLFRGKEQDNEDCLHIAGVTDMSKVVLFEDPASKERKLEQMKRSQGIAKACEAVYSVTVEVDKLSDRVSALQAAVYGGTMLVEKEFDVSTELLMIQLMKLDAIEAEGEAKVQRKSEVRRIQSLVDTLDSLKARNSDLFSNGSNAVSATPQWEKFDSGFGSLTAPHPMPSSTTNMDDSDQFE